MWPSGWTHPSSEDGSNRVDYENLCRKIFRNCKWGVCASVASRLGLRTHRLATSMLHARPGTRLWKVKPVSVVNLSHLGSRQDPRARSLPSAACAHISFVPLVHASVSTGSRSHREREPGMFCNSTRIHGKVPRGLRQQPLLIIQQHAP